MLIRDVMSTRFTTIHPDATLREAATAFQAEPDHGGVPNLLVMEGDRLLGLVTLTDVLRVLLPPSIAQDPRLAHLAWDGLIEAQYQRVREKRVRDIMTRHVVTIDESAVLAEAAEHLVTGRIHALPVLRGGTVVGVLSLADLARRIFARVGGQPE